MPFFSSKKQGREKSNHYFEDDRFHVRKASSGISGISSHNSAGSEKSGGSGSRTSRKRTPHFTWPKHELFVTDNLEYDDNGSSESIDVSIWKSAPSTDNEAPKIVNKKELYKHRSKVDAWIGISDKIYDVSSFIDHHPGGYATISKGIGRDATKLFMKAHPKVDPNQYVGRNCVGIYIADYPNPRKLKSVVSKVDYDESGRTRHCCIPKCISRNSDYNPESEFELKFTQNEHFVILFIKAPSVLNEEKFGPDSWTMVIWDKELLFIKVMWLPQKCWVAEYHFSERIDNEFLYISFTDEYKKAILMLPKGIPPKNWKEFGYPDLIDRNCSVEDPSNIEFDDATRALLFFRRPINRNVSLYGFKIRPSSYLGVPEGYSVILTVNDMGARLFPTSFSLLESKDPKSDIKGQIFYFLISQDFSLTQILNELNTFDESMMMEAAYLCIGSSQGEFDMSYVRDADTLVLLTSGLGIAPLTRIIRYFKDQHPEHLKDKHVLLLYFNLKKSDIIWMDELIALNSSCSWFHLFLIVEKPESDWVDQLVGSISVHLVKWCMEAIPDVSIQGLQVNAIASGDQDFLRKCKRVFETMRDAFDKTAMFIGSPEIFV